MKKKKKEQLISIESIEECFVHLNSIFRSSERERIRQMSENEFGIETHFSTGGWIRNNWIRDGRLAFIGGWHEKGARHIDDYSSIILTSYYRYLTGKEIDWEGQLEDCLNYQLIHCLPDHSEFPNEFPKSELNTTISYSYKEADMDMRLLVLSNKKEDKVWIYNYFYGWKHINKIIAEDIEQNSPLTSKYIAGLF